MSEEEIKKEVMNLRERVVRLEVKVEELTKRIENIANYTKQLYEYLQKQTGKSLFQNWKEKKGKTRAVAAVVELPSFSLF